MKKLLSKLRQAINDFNLIEEGDRIAVGLSGGKDSLSLLKLLRAYKDFSPVKFDVLAITLNPGSGCNFSSMYKFCKEIDVEFHEIPTDIYEIVFDIRKEKNPCSLCAKLRRGALNDAAKKLGCNKVALGHHKDDALETLLLSMFYEGRVSSFSPKTYLEKCNLKIIRPMVYIEESSIKKFACDNSLPIVKNPCPADGHTKREDAKTLIKKLNHDIPCFKKNLFGCLNNTDQMFLWDKNKISKI